MKKYEILAELSAFCRKYDIPKHVVTISYGAASVIIGTKRDTGDINTFIPRDHYERLKDLGLCTKVHDCCPGEIPPVEVVYEGNVEFHCIEPHARKDFNECNGFRVVTPKQLILDRLALGRKKDMADVGKMIYHPAVRRLLNREEVERCKILFKKHSL